jgi:hypothetical protein
MGQAVPTHPAVVLRSHYNHLRALLVAAMIALAGLTAAVVILATDDETSGSFANSQSALSAQEKRRAAYDAAIRALTPEQVAALVDARAEPRPTEDQVFPGLARQAQAATESLGDDGRRGQGAGTD